ncbi:N-acetyltransferase [Rhodovulum sp. 12E13]|uniref:GNAT family N-acetyltransferase n=1 Tax=Rhodovulum sp. 12E13 TaxID=2203891 RepID=UPI000E12D0D9|nr:GNAT family protein [Rhodovulum sp. 12E13]RDC74814.1 N-acetyltransferase [Rhodovulum sp. 12E13]
MPHLSDTPVPETERLVLRVPRAGDFGMWDTSAQSDRSRYMGGPYRARDPWRAFANVVGHWVLRGWREFVFGLEGSDVPLGHGGPWFPEGGPEREIGGAVWDPAAEGKGYAFEAAQAARAHAFDVLGGETAVSSIAPGNARSVALVEQPRAVRDPQAAVVDEGDLVYRHPAPARSAA